MTLNIRKPLTMGLVAAAAALALAACGSSGAVDPSSSAPAPADSSSSASASDTPSASETATDGIDQAAVDLGVKYSGGKAGAADSSLPPVKIGFANQQGGTPAFPEYEASADAAVKFINEKLGGVGGHPLELVKCVLQTEEDGQKCAAQFLADPAVKIGILGTSVVGNATFYKTINGKFPVIVSAAGGVADSTSPHVYELDGGSAAILQAFAATAKSKGAKTVAVVSTGNAGGKYVAGQVLEPGMKAAGIAPTVAYVSDTATAPEYTSAMQAAGAASADVIVLIASGADMCVNFYNSLKEIGATAPVLTAYGCYGDPVPTATGGGPVGWTFFGLNDNQRADTSPEATLYRNVMTWADKAKFINVAAAPMAMADVFAIANMSNSVGFESLSGAAYETAIKTLPNPLFLVPGTIKCGVYPDKAQVGLCGDSAAVSSYSGTQWQIDAPFKAVTLG